MSVIRHIFQGRIVDLRLEEATLPSGARITIEIVRHRGAAAVVAVDERNEVTLVRQFRYAAGGFIWEIPAGTLEDGEAPAQCAARELREEVGLIAAEWTPLGRVFTSPGFCDERIDLFLARGLSPGVQQLGHDEVLTVAKMPYARALAMVRSGEIEDAKSIAGLHRAATHLRLGTGR